jgi:hypothetical protein
MTTCNDCKFCKSDYCCRHPPVIDHHGFTSRPYVIDWEPCGDFEKRKDDSETKKRGRPPKAKL